MLSTETYESNDLKTALSGQRKKYCSAILWLGQPTEEIIKGAEENIKSLLTYDNMIPIAVVLTASEKEEKTRKCREDISKAFLYSGGGERASGLILNYLDEDANSTAKKIDCLFKISSVSLRKRN